ncbi:hypothetical protein Tco_1064161 [Tanacetum coccineum]
MRIGLDVPLHCALLLAIVCFLATIFYLGLPNDSLLFLDLVRRQSIGVLPMQWPRLAGCAIGTDNQEKDEKQSQNDKTGLGMEKTVKDKAKSKPESQSSQQKSQLVKVQVNPEAKVTEI